MKGENIIPLITREKKLISSVRRDCLAIPTRHVEGEPTTAAARSTRKAWRHAQRSCTTRPSRIRSRDPSRPPSWRPARTRRRCRIAGRWRRATSSTSSRTQGLLTHPGYRVKLVDIQQPHDRRAFQAALTAILQDMGQARGDLAKKRAWTKFLMLGRVLVARQQEALGKGTVSQAQHPQLEHVRAAPTLDGRALLQRALG